MALAMLAQLLRGAIDADRYPFSPEIRILKEILAMIRQEPVRPPPPPLRSYAPLSMGRYRRGR